MSKKVSSLEFKTNINCQNCIRAVSGFLDEIKELEHWEVDTDNPDKILQVRGTMSPAAIVEAVEDAGFDIEPIPEG